MSLPRRRIISMRIREVFHGFPDRQWYAGDRAYPGYPADIFLYRRGETEPAAVFGGQNFRHCTWKLQIHPNPTFSRDGKRIYLNYPVNEERTRAMFVTLEELTGAVN